MKKIIQQLYGDWDARGMKGRIVSVNRLRELQAELEKQRIQGMFDEEFYRERLTFFSFQLPEDLPSAASIFVIAVPRPQTRIRFTRADKTISLLLPPTYRGYLEIKAQVMNQLNELLKTGGYRAVSARLPEKSLAVHSGLAEYGKNNICYIPGMGSFFQIVTFCSDLPCPEDPWRAPCVMNRCTSCRACQEHCPTGAITPDRFLLHAERCLVYHNEKAADHPFPAWIDPAVHHCIIGCMRCQQVCPEDKEVLGWFDEDVEFSHEETDMLTDGVLKEKLPAATRQKLEQLELLDWHETLQRNLAVFIQRI